MFLTIEIEIKKAIATGGILGRQQGKETRDKLVIIISIIRNLGNKSWL